jgi:hypothetical protein
MVLFLGGKADRGKRYEVTLTNSMGNVKDICTMEEWISDTSRSDDNTDTSNSTRTQMEENTLSVSSLTTSV